MIMIYTSYRLPDYLICLQYTYQPPTEQAITTTTLFLITFLKIFSDFFYLTKIFCASKDFVIHSQLEMKEKLWQNLIKTS